VQLGETFVVETVSFRTPIIRTPEDANPVQYREREETWPVFVKGVEPGDMLAMERPTTARRALHLPLRLLRPRKLPSDSNPERFITECSSGWTEDAPDAREELLDPR